MTNAGLTDFHTAAHAAFLVAGLADEGSYSATVTRVANTGVAGFAYFG